MGDKIIIDNVIQDIYKVIDKINTLQNERFIEDLDYIKNHLANAINYKEGK